jgi:hypothetical protein
MVKKSPYPFKLFINIIKSKGPIGGDLTWPPKVLFFLNFRHLRPKKNPNLAHVKDFCFINASKSPDFEDLKKQNSPYLDNRFKHVTKI